MKWNPSEALCLLPVVWRELQTEIRRCFRCSQPEVSFDNENFETCENENPNFENFSENSKQISSSKEE